MATKFYPKSYIDQVEFAELGDDITLTTTVERHNIMAHAWGSRQSKEVLCVNTFHNYTWMTV